MLKCSHVFLCVASEWFDLRCGLKIICLCSEVPHCLGKADNKQDTLLNITGWFTLPRFIAPIQRFWNCLSICFSLFSSQQQCNHCKALLVQRCTHYTSVVSVSKQFRRRYRRHQVAVNQRRQRRNKAGDAFCTPTTIHSIKPRGVELPVCAKVLQVKPDDTLLHKACGIWCNKFRNTTLTHGTGSRKI